MPDLSAIGSIGAWVFAGGGLAAGVLGLGAVRLAGRVGPGVAPAAICLLALGACCGLTGRAPGLVWPPLVLGGLLLLFALLRRPQLAPALAAALCWCGKPERQWAALAVACPAVAGILVLAAPRTRRPDADPPPIRPAPAALTDRGRSLPVSEVVPGSWTADGLQEAERRELAERGLLGRVMRTAPPDWSYNCHGWVFADGRYVVPDADVPLILQNNGYVLDNTPATGDLAVYRDDDGRICHTGLVWGVGEGEAVLVESKWGWMGRYLHAPDATPYGGRVSYYRSPRAGHRLDGLPRASPGDNSAGGSSDAALHAD